MTRICFLLLILTAAVANAEIPAERYGQITLDTLPANGLLVNTFSDRTLVFDADRQQILGMLSLGIGANAVEVDREQGRIHVAENYFSRHTRGTRTDVITSYDIATLAPVAEIEIPPKHASGSPLRHYSGVLKSGDSSLMLVMNITPAVSVSVADLKSGRFLGEISTAGCGMIY
ncbi:MAG: amine dehydrogenase large subunit, partial [Proteobacteria bacterium]|nr:amine dehydrogenase large subunit [Pseudomonadota bacterium]